MSEGLGKYFYYPCSDGSVVIQRREDDADVLLQGEDAEPFLQQIEALDARLEAGEIDNTEYCNVYDSICSEYDDQMEVGNG